MPGRDHSLRHLLVGHVGFDDRGLGATTVNAEWLPNERLLDRFGTDVMAAFKRELSVVS